MHWLWYLAFGYLAFCAIGWIAVFKLCPNDESDDRLSRALKAYPIRMRIGLVLAAVIVGLLFPLVMAYGAWVCWSIRRSERREWEKFGRTFRPVEFVAIHPANLPVEPQQHFEQCSSILECLGFVPAVTCQLKPEPKPVLARCLLSQDGETEASVAWFYGSPGLSFNSVLKDGHVLETGCVEVSLPQDEIDEINRSGRFTTQMFEVGEGGNFADQDFLLAAYRSHLERLAELEGRLGCATLRLSADQLPELKRYANAVYGQWRFDQGQVDNRPEPQPFPKGIARQVADPLRAVAVVG